MKKTILLILAFIVLNAFGQQKSFSSLETISFSSSASAKYNAQYAKVFNTELSELDKTDPLFYDEDEGAYDVKLFKTKLHPKDAHEYMVVFSPGPSADPAFLFYRLGQYDSPEFILDGLHIVIPVNGCVYISGHANNYFDTRKKFEIIDGKPQEVEQPFYYVGLETKTLEPIILFETQNLNNKLVSIPADYEIEVLLNKKGTSLYLIKTSFGLIGWIDIGYVGQRPTKIDKLYYNGD